MNATATSPCGTDESDDSGPSALSTRASDHEHASEADAPAESDRPPPEPEVEIEQRDRRGRRDPLDLGWIEAKLRAALALVRHPVDRLGVSYVDEPQMRELHERHCGQDRSTDVLTFPLSEPRERIDADIAVCVDEAARNAEQRGHRVERELLLYCLHGVLHCAGFDDRTPEAFQAMHAEEDRILRAIGIGATFRGDEAGPDGPMPPERGSREP